MSRTKKRVLHVVISLGVIVLGATVFLVLTAGRPQLKRTRPPVPVPLVRVLKVHTAARVITVRGEGTVKPLREIQLIPEVNGKVVYTSPALVDGGAFTKGQVLLRIDPVDYELAITLARARVKDSESRLKVAEEEAAASREEWRLLYKGNPGGAGEPPALVAKEPQLAAARAKLAADRAELRKALLNLERTRLRAPFDGRVSQENVDVGQYVSVGQPLATLFSTEAAEIIVPLDDAALYWFYVPGFTPGTGPGAAAKISAQIAGRALTWPGRVVRAEGRLDERTRMINVVIRVEKPYATMPPLAAGLFVAVQIQGRTLENAAEIPRSALREDNRVWVVNDKGRLNFRRVKVARLGSRRAIVSAGLENGERVVTSSLSVVTDGMQVRVAPGKENDPS